MNDINSLSFLIERDIPVGQGVIQTIGNYKTSPFEPESWKYSSVLSLSYKVKSIPKT